MNSSSIVMSQGQGREVDRRATDRDDLLQASRRVDWRFLLPDPDLPDVAVIAGADSRLIGSLRRLGNSVTMLDEGARSDCVGRFPLVVAGNPNRDELIRAVQATRCQGFVYIEIDRQRLSRSSSRHSNAPRGVEEWLAALTRLHVMGLQVHWHWPNFDSCTEIVPLFDQSAARCTLRRRGTGFRSRWKASLALVLLKAGLFTACVPCFSVLGQRFQQEDSSVRPIQPWGK